MDVSASASLSPHLCVCVCVCLYASVFILKSVKMYGNQMHIGECIERTYSNSHKVNSFSVVCKTEIVQSYLKIPTER